MSTLYIPEHERAALRSIDREKLRELIDEAISTARPSPLYGLRLANCGPYVAERLRRFERDLAYYEKAKAAQKRSDTRSRAISAGSDLRWAVSEMIGRMEEEEKEVERFWIDDQIPPPYRLRERIEVRVSYRWRQPGGEAWSFGSITFAHEVTLRPDYEKPQPKRKPSAAKQEEERQDELLKHWEHLRSLALQSVREYLRDGGDGAAIPEAFQAKADGHSRFLNNFSCDFWRGEAGRSQARA